jgi:hypothetical protein
MISNQRGKLMTTKITIQAPWLDNPISIESFNHSTTSIESYNETKTFNMINAYYRKEIQPLVATYFQKVFDGINALKPNIENVPVTIKKYTKPTNETMYSNNNNTIDASYDLIGGYISFNIKRLENGLNLDDDKDRNTYQDRYDNVVDKIIFPLLKKIENIQQKNSNIFHKITKEMYFDISLGGGRKEDELVANIRTTLQVDLPIKK